jgi:hypothetical protein
MQFHYRVKKSGITQPNIPQFKNHHKDLIKLNLDNTIELPVVKQDIPEFKPSTEVIKQKKRVLVVHNVESVNINEKEQFMVNAHVEEQVMERPIDQPDNSQKLKELQEFTMQQELIRQNELREFTRQQTESFESQKEEWLRIQEHQLKEQKDALEQTYVKALEDKDNWIKQKESFESQKEEWLRIQEQQLKEQKTTLEQTYLKALEDKDNWIQQTELLLHTQKQKWVEDKDHWMQQSELLLHTQKQKWLEEQEIRFQKQKEEWIKEHKSQMSYVKKEELEPVLEKYITQVISCTVSSEHDSSETKFEKLIGPVIERIVKKVLDTDYAETVPNDNNSDCDNSVQYDDIYDIEVDEASIQTIQNVLSNKTVNPLLNKFERAYTEQISGTYSPSVELDTIYEKRNDQFFDNELRSKLGMSKKWFTYGAGVRKDVITSVYVDHLTNNFVIGGLFQTVNMVQVQNIAFFNHALKLWDNMKGGVSNMVTCIAMYKNTIYVGGVFATSGDGVPTKHISSFDTVTKTWKPLGDGLNAECCTICIDAKYQKLYAGGTFTQSGNTALPYIGIYNIQSDTWERIVNGDLNAPCRTLYLDTNTTVLYCGGLFTAVGQTNIQYIAEYNIKNQSWSSLAQGLQGYCNSICVHENKLYAGGTFTCVGNNIAVFHLVSREWSNLKYGLNGICNTIVVNNSGHVFVGGSFTCENESDQVLNRIAMYNTTNESWYPLQNYKSETTMEEHLIGLDSTCKSLFLCDNILYVAGSFQKAGNIDAGCIAKYKV